MKWRKAYQAKLKQANALKLAEKTDTRSIAVKAGYRSGLEIMVATLMEQNAMQAKYEEETLRYIQPEQKKRYIPDFYLPEYDCYIEVKGLLDAASRKKMLLVKEQYPEKKFIFLFGKPENKISKASHTTYAKWCESNNIMYCGLAEFKNDPKLTITTTLTKGSECLFDLKSPEVGISTSQPKRKQKPSKKSVSK